MYEFMIELLLTIATGLFDMFILIVFLDGTMQERKKNVPKWAFYAGFVIVELILILNMFFFSTHYSFNQYLFTSCLSIFTTFCLTYYYNSPLLHRIFVSFLFLFFASIAENIICLLVAYLYPELIEESPLLYNIAGSGASKFIIFLLVLLTNVLWKRNYRKYPMSYKMSVLLTPLITCMISMSAVPAVPSTENTIFYLCSVLGILLLNFVNYYLLHNVLIVNQQNYIIDSQKNQIAMQSEKFQQLFAAYHDTRSIVHDTKKHFFYLQSCVERQEYDHIIEYLHNSMELLEASYQTIDSGNLVIDAFLSSYRKVAEQEGIHMELDIQVESHRIRYIDDYDLCIIIGNLLDNSMNANRMIKPPATRYIRIHIVTTDMQFVIHFENPLVEYDKIKKDSTWQLYHGFGLDNAKMAAEKYDGTFHTAEENYFLTLVVIPLFDRTGTLPRP